MPEVLPRPTDEETANQPGERLESWKEIAAYLRRGVRTVQRWERTEFLPVYRHRHDKRGTVYAYRQEIDAWREHRREGVERAAGDGDGSTAGPIAGPVAEALQRLVLHPGKASRAARLAALILFSLAAFVVWSRLGGATG